MDAPAFTVSFPVAESMAMWSGVSATNHFYDSVFLSMSDAVTAVVMTVPAATFSLT